MNKLSIAVSLVLAMAGGTFAGAKYALPVEVGDTWFYGSMGSARSSADSSQYIGCSLGTSGTSVYASCAARGRNSEGVYQYKSCSSTNANHVEVVKSVGPMSALDVSMDAVTGACRHISITNYSYYAPMVP